MNETRAQKVMVRYAVAPDPVRVYAPTQVLFSRPLGINYTTIGLSTPLSSYMAKAKMYYAPQTAMIKQMEQPIKKFDNARNNLFSEIYSLRKSDYNSREKLYN